MRVSGILLFILILGGFSRPRCGATVYNSNGSPASVQSIHNNQAQNGDTITLPAGTFTWSRRVHITKAITLQGAGVGQTVIKDAVQGDKLLQVNLAANQLTRLTGIGFQDGGRINTALAPGGILHVDGSNTNGSTFRFDHCKWNNLNGATVFDTVIGVINHNTFVTDRFSPPIYSYGSHWNGQNFGDGSWAAPTGFGSSQFLFIEDNTFTHSNPSRQAIVDAYAGARFVVRYNNIFNGIVYAHGTESTGRPRGGRAMEVYQNTFTGTNLNRILGTARSGGVLFHDNSISGYWGDLATFTLQNFRNFHPFPPWGGADGTNAWDVNDPRVFFTGTAAAKSSGTTVTVSGANWTPNQWVGYTIRRTSNNCNSGSVTYGQIESNTKNRITYTDNGGYPKPSLAFCAGDALQIRKVDHALDQPGRALGSLITRNPPGRPAGWNNQVTEPCYSWNNGQAGFSGGPGVRANVHYFNNTPMPGYTPYVYPHPLVSATARAVVADFNGDGRPDWVLYAGTRQTAMWYLNNNVYVGSDFGPTLPAGWELSSVADFNSDSHPDYALLIPTTDRTAIWYLNGPTVIGAAYGPSLPGGWELVAMGDFNGDDHPDYVCYKAATHQTAIFYLNNKVCIGAAYGPTLPATWSFIGVADFNRDGHTDYALVNYTNGQTLIGYLSGRTVIGAAYGPTPPAGWKPVATADFNGDGYPDFLLYNLATRQTAIWYLNDNVYVGSAYGPTLPAGWSLIAP
jgi:hypothetical protein